MTVTLPSRRHDALPTNAPKAQRLAHLAPWALVVALLLTNAATLLNDRVHNVAYGVVASIAGHSGQVLAEALLSRSPARAKESAVKEATRQLDAKNRALHEEIRSVKASEAALTQRHAALQATSVKRAAAVRAVATRTSTVLATRSAEAISTLPARAVPYLGIAALVGFTTLELQADCEVARALAQLNADHGNESIDVGKVCNAVGAVPSPQDVWNNVKTQASSAIRMTYGVIERFQ